MYEVYGMFKKKKKTYWPLRSAFVLFSLSGMETVHVENIGLTTEIIALRLWCCYNLFQVLLRCGQHLRDPHRIFSPQVYSMTHTLTRHADSGC